MIDNDRLICVNKLQYNPTSHQSHYSRYLTDSLFNANNGIKKIIMQC